MTERCRYPLTKYEKARILGQRAAEIEKGATVYVEVDKSMWNSMLIAEMEFEQGVLPYMVRRTNPDGTKCEIPLSELVHQ